MKKIIKRKKLRKIISISLYLFLIIFIGGIVGFYYMGLYIALPMLIITIYFFYVNIIDFINFREMEKNVNNIGYEICELSSDLFLTENGIVSFDSPFFVKYEDILYVYKVLSFKILSGSNVEKLKIVSKGKKKYTIYFGLPFFLSIKFNNNIIKKIVKVIKKNNSNVEIKFDL